MCLQSSYLARTTGTWPFPTVSNLAPAFFLTFRPDPTPRVMDRSCVTHVGAIFAPIHRRKIDSQRLIAARNQSAAFHRHELQGQLALALAADNWSTPAMNHRVPCCQAVMRLPNPFSVRIGRGGRTLNSLISQEIITTLRCTVLPKRNHKQPFLNNRTPRR